MPKPPLPEPIREIPPPPSLLRKAVPLGVVVFWAFSCAGLFGARGWLFELFSHFRLQYGAALLALAAAAIALRSWTWMTAALCGAAVNVLAMGAYLPGPTPVPVAPSAPASPELRLICWNAKVDNPYKEFAAQALRRRWADVVGLVEINRAWEGALARAESVWTNRLVVPRNDPFGMALFASLPARRIRPVYLGSGCEPSIEAELEAHGVPIYLLLSHPVPPETPRYAALRNEQLLASAKLLASRAGPRIWMGDFNLTPFSPWYSKLLRISGLRDTLRGRGYQWSWPADMPWLGIPIDHCWVSEDFRVLGRRVERGPGSDHRMLQICLEMRGAAASRTEGLAGQGVGKTPRFCSSARRVASRAWRAH
ncbi:MAG: endonuclease/exonuclease/phosphatase family protein [Verrucomicrobia bacterium]|nr:endonuclease/exonuclease/phosphatase family protein [Verrucomicrobiota bacterium]